MTANSASGSKYYELINSQQDYIEVRSQNWLPSYSVIDLTKDDFKITTYQITDEGKVEKYCNNPLLFTKTVKQISPKPAIKGIKKDIKRHKRSNSVPRKLQKALRDVDRIDRGSKMDQALKKQVKKSTQL